MATNLAEPAEQDAFPTLEDMDQGLKAVAERIRESVPRLASLELPRADAYRPEHIERAAEELGEVTANLEPLWPNDD